MKKKYKVLFLKGSEPGEIVSDILKKLERRMIIEIIYEDMIPYSDFDILLSVSYPSKISKMMCDKARLGAVNLHTGLLPKQRGSCPLNWALIWGDKETGLTLHKIVDTYDAGDIVLQKKISIEEEDNIKTLRTKAFAFFFSILDVFFANPEWYLRNAYKQNQAEMSYAQKRIPADSELNLKAPAKDLYNLFRSCDPELYPAFIMKDGEKRIVRLVTPDGVWYL